MIVRNREDELKALEDSVNAISRIMLSSAYNSHLDPDFKDIIDFNEFHEIYTKLSSWRINFEKRMNEKGQFIAFTKTSLPYGWLGNMSPHPVIYNDKEWRTTEALFQALRFSDENIQEAIRSEKSPMSAKLKAKSMADKMIIKQLSSEDVENMKLCIRLKIEQHPSLKNELIFTDNLRIYEDVSNRGDGGSNLFWGAKLYDGFWVGQNVLGKLWMELREQIKK